MAQESGIATPTAEDLIRLDRHRTGKRLSNEVDLPPSSGGDRSEDQAAFRMVIASMLARASAGVR